jgi:hypothetical protein
VAPLAQELFGSDQLSAGHDDGVSVDRPLQLGDAGVQIATDGGQGNVDDGGVHGGEDERQTARDQNDEPAT